MMKRLFIGIGFTDELKIILKNINKSLENIVKLLDIQHTIIFI